MSSKRKAEEGAGPSKKRQQEGASGGIVNKKRVRKLKEGAIGAGPVIYW